MWPERQVRAALEAQRKAQAAELKQVKKAADAARAAALAAQTDAHQEEFSRRESAVRDELAAAHAHGFWKAAPIFGALAALVFLTLGCVGTMAVMSFSVDRSFDAAAEFGERQTMTGALMGQHITERPQRPPSGQDGWARGREPASAP